MEQARDGDVAVLTGRVTLVQETDQNVQAGVLLYRPIYRNGAPCETVEQRRTASWALCLPRSACMISWRGSWARTAPRVGFEVLDAGTSEGHASLFQCDGHKQGDALVVPSLRGTTQISLAGRVWTLCAFALPEFEVAHATPVPLLVYSSSLAISVLLATVVWSLASANGRGTTLPNA